LFASGQACTTPDAYDASETSLETRYLLNPAILMTPLREWQLACHLHPCGEKQMKRFLQDLRYALRQLRRSPGFAAVAILTLALGIGANTAIFSVLDSILLQPLPFPQANRLVQIDAQSGLSSFPKGWIREYQRRATTLASISGYTLNAEYNVTGGSASDRAFGGAVSVNFFDTLGVRPLLGRFFSAPEEQAGQDNEVVLSHGYWQQHFGSDMGVLGKKIQLDGVDREIIGVAPAGISFPDATTQFWIPISFKPSDNVDPWAVFGFRAIGRLKDGIQPSHAQGELRSFHRQMLTLFPWRMPDDWVANVSVVPLLDSIVGETRPRLLLLLGAVALVLLIACANVANLMLARAASRQREIALRRALGAGTRRLLQQVLTESGLIAALSGIAGIVLAAVTLHALKLLLPPDTPRLANIALHGDVLVFAVVVSLVTGIVAGLAPAWKAAGLDLQSSLRLNETNVFGSAGRFRTSRLLVIGQIALAVIVITAAGIMLRSLSRLSGVDPGFRTSSLVSAQISLDRNACHSKGACTAFYQNLVARAHGLTGVTGAALIDALPLSGVDAGYAFDAEGHPRSPSQLALTASSRIVSAEYLPLMDIHLRRGRLFASLDATGATRAILVDQSLANHLWSNQDPIGKHLESLGDEASPSVMDPKTAAIVVGLVSDTRHESLDTGAGGEVYLPLSPNHEKPVMNIVLRSSLDAGEIAGELRRMVAEINPNIPVTRIRTMDEVVAASTAAPRALAILLALFASLAIGVGAIGVYSLIAYTTSWRMREFGLRLALGANRRQVSGLILRESLALTATGALLGLAGAYAVTNLMRGFLFETSPADPLTYALVLVLFGALSVIAAWRPAYRASLVEPMEVLRSE
jgi:predicted permease